MIGTCKKCGFEGPEPAKVLVTQEDLSRIESTNDAIRKQLSTLQMTASAMLEILMASTNAQRISTIARLGNKVFSGRLLESIRKANRE